ncbi:MAG TPA: efflux RND transporter periplasmic adaptor subunit [Lacipirellula sp.]
MMAISGWRGSKWMAAAAMAALVLACVIFGPELVARARNSAAKLDNAASTAKSHDDEPEDAGEHDHEHGLDHEGHDHAAHDHEGHDHEEHEGHDHAEHAGEKAAHDESGEAADDHAGHDHEHAHDDENVAVLELSPQALKNIGYKALKVATGSYERTISLPGMVVERPGRTQVHVSAPLGGVVTQVHVIQGEAVAPGTPLFDIRLTHEELVSAQGEFLQTTEELDVVNREIARLERLAEGVVAGSRIRDQQYQRQKLEARLRAQRQGLLLHGLSVADVDGIVQSRQLLQSLTVRAPEQDDENNCGDHLFVIQTLSVQRGQQVDAGAPLAVLADHCQLYIEGTAFEEDAERIRQAAAQGLSIGADLLVRDRREEALSGLKVLYLADQVDRDSRAFHFYLLLPNEIVLDRTEGGHRFLQWRFKPGQRVELRVPVERWENRLVVPASAVVDDGAETYVFVEEEPGHFHRTPVHVAHRDRRSVVIEDGGALHAGDKIAARGAFEMHLDLKNRAGGGIDPHAGHSH